MARVITHEEAASFDFVGAIKVLTKDDGVHVYYAGDELPDGLEAGAPIPAAPVAVIEDPQLPSDETPAVPRVLTRRQFFVALLRFDLLDAVKAIVAGSGSLEVEITFDTATEFERNHPMIEMMAPALGLTDEQIDQVFLLGAAL